MQSSIWKTIWQVSDKILRYIFILFGICYFVILILIFIQEKSDWYDAMTIFTIFYAIDILIAIAIHLPIWVQIIYFPCFLFFYYTRAYNFFYSLNLGINYDFVWTLPQQVNNLLGISLQGKIIDFIFWSGFICTLLLFLMQIKAWILKFLIKRKVDFALEVEKEAKEQLMNKKIKYGTNQIEKPLTTKQKIKKGIFYLFLIIGLTGLIILGLLFVMNLEEQKYPTLWQTKFDDGTAICFEESCGGKGNLLPGEKEPGEPRVATFYLDKENKELILDVFISTQRRVRPEAFLEIELKNPDSKRVFYLNKEEVIKGPPADSHEENASFSKRFKFIADKPGQYTLTIIPYNYGIVSIDVRVRDIK